MARSRLVIVTLLVGATVGCGAAEHGGHAEPAAARSATPAAAGFDLTTAEVVDLTYPLGPETLFWPTAPIRFELTELHFGPTEGGFFYAANTFSMPEHGGTHLDAPIHFGEGRLTTDEVPVGRLVAPAVVIDVAARAAADPDYALDLDALDAWEAEHGAVPEGAIVLLRTGWGERWPDHERYFGSPPGSGAADLHFPAYGAEAARVLVEERDVAALGVDTASIDIGPSTDFMVHRIAAAADVPGLENVANLDRLPPTGAWVVALPLKIEGGSGGPVRIVALLEGR